MNQRAHDFVDYICNKAPKHDKATLQECAAREFDLVKDSTVYHCESFAVRFAYSKSSSPSFSNTILALSRLRKYDNIPFFVVVARRNADNLILLSNTTFLKKISHSSQSLSTMKITGSFNGSDIYRTYNGVENKPESFDQLFAEHERMEWSDNLTRLVNNSSEITPIKQRFIPTEREREIIYGSVEKAIGFVRSESFAALRDDLNNRCDECRDAIAIASRIDNTNIRGRLIECLITADEATRTDILEWLTTINGVPPRYDSKNGLGDYIRRFSDTDAYIDIKTKVITLSSNPKAYNIDDFLSQMAKGNSVLLFFFMGLDETGICCTRLCSVYHKELLSNTLFQRHWSGRATIGETQFNGKAINRILRQEGFANEIDLKLGRDFLKQLLDK